MKENVIFFFFTFVLLYIKRPRDACGSGTFQTPSKSSKFRFWRLGFGGSFRLENMKLLPSPKKLASCILVWCRSISEIAPCKVTMWPTAALNGISALPRNSTPLTQWAVEQLSVVCGEHVNGI